MPFNGKHIYISIYNSKLKYSITKNYSDYNISGVLKNICQYSMVTHGINSGYQNLGSPLHQKQEISNTARCLETAFYILTFHVVIRHLYFNLNTFQ